MNNREFAEWSKYKSRGFTYFFMKRMLLLSVAPSIGKVLHMLMMGSYEWDWSVECYVDVFAVFVAQWLFSIVLIAMISPFYWRYGIWKYDEYMKGKIQ